MTRLLTAAIAVTAIAAFISPGSQRLSYSHHDIYISAVQRNLACSAQSRQIRKLSDRLLPDGCPDTSITDYRS